MNGKHYAQTQTTQRGRSCALIHGSWRRVGVRLAAAGACALMAGQLLLPSVVLATELEGTAVAQTEAAGASVAPAASTATGANASPTGSTGSTGSMSASAAEGGSVSSQPAAADSQPGAGSQGARTGTSDASVSSSSDAAGDDAATGGQIAAGATAASISGTQAQGVTDATDGSGVEVKTTVVEHDTECSLPSNITLVKGQSYTFDFPDVEDGIHESAYDKIRETRYYKADAATGVLVEVAEPSASNVAVRLEPVENHVRAILTFTNDEGAADGSYKLTLNDKKYLGSALSYSRVEGSDIAIGDPNDFFNSDSGGSGATINETRHDYYLSYRFDSMVELVGQATPIDNAAIGFYADFKDGDAPRPLANTSFEDSGKYYIADEYWEEMDESGNPVAYWHSNEEENARVPESKQLTKFEEGKHYMYSLVLRQNYGYEFADNCAVTINDKSLDSRNITKTNTGLFLVAVSQFTCEKALEWQAVDTVEIDGATTTFKVGDRPIFTGSTPEGASFWYQCEFWRAEDGAEVNSAEFWDKEIEKHVDAFEAGKAYRYGMYVKAHEGFYFTRSTKVKINGKFYSFEWSGADEDEMNRWDGKTTTMWVYTDLTMTPEATPAPADPEKPSTGGTETPATNPSDNAGQQADDKGGNTAKPQPAADKAKGSSKNTTADAKAGEKASDSELAATGDDAALTVVAMGVAGATVAAAGLAVSKRRG